MSEAAKELRISRRALQELIKVHRLYYENGNRKLFTESDIVALRDAMRPVPRRPVARSQWEEAMRRVGEMRSGARKR